MKALLCLEGINFYFTDPAEKLDLEKNTRLCANLNTPHSRKLDVLCLLDLSYQSNGFSNAGLKIEPIDMSFMESGFIYITLSKEGFSKVFSPGGFLESTFRDRKIGLYSFDYPLNPFVF